MSTLRIQISDTDGYRRLVVNDEVEVNEGRARWTSGCLRLRRALRCFRTCGRRGQPLHICRRCCRGASGCFETSYRLVKKGFQWFGINICMFIGAAVFMFYIVTYLVCIGNWLRNYQYPTNVSSNDTHLARCNPEEAQIMLPYLLINFMVYALPWVAIVQWQWNGNEEKLRHWEAKFEDLSRTFTDQEFQIEIRDSRHFSMCLHFFVCFVLNGVNGSLKCATCHGQRGLKWAISYFAHNVDDEHFPTCLAVQLGYFTFLFIPYFFYCKYAAELMYAIDCRIWYLRYVKHKWFGRETPPGEILENINLELRKDGWYKDVGHGSIADFFMTMMICVAYVLVVVYCHIYFSANPPLLEWTHNVNQVLHNAAMPIIPFLFILSSASRHQKENEDLIAEAETAYRDVRQQVLSHIDNYTDVAKQHTMKQWKEIEKVLNDSKSYVIHSKLLSTHISSRTAMYLTVLATTGAVIWQIVQHINDFKVDRGIDDGFIEVYFVAIFSFILLLVVIGVAWCTGGESAFTKYSRLCYSLVCYESCKKRKCLIQWLVTVTLAFVTQGLLFIPWYYVYGDTTCRLGEQTTTNT